jgi:hypothetical protein
MGVSITLGVYSKSYGTRKLKQEFHLNSSSRTPAINTLWHNISDKGTFDLEGKYVNGESAFFAYMQALSNGCVATAILEARPYYSRTSQYRNSLYRTTYIFPPYTGELSKTEQGNLYGSRD